MDSIIIRYSEIALKGGNRTRFEQRLVNNIHDCLRKQGNPGKVSRIRGRIIIHTDKECLELKKVFGIASYSNATMVDADTDAIKSLIADINPGKSFRISVKRVTKEYPKTSMELERELGAFVMEKNETKVSLKGYETEIGVELHSGKAYVFTERIEGFGGLPLGISGKALALIEDENSIVAAWLMMKRGVHVVPVSTSDQDISLLESYAYGPRIVLHRIDNAHEMQSLAERENTNTLIVGQTLKTFKELDTPFITLRPLISYDQNEINELKERIS